MANQPPPPQPRPWFRLGSIARPNPTQEVVQPQPPPTQPRPPLTRQAFTTPFRPPAVQPQETAAPPPLPVTVAPPTLTSSVSTSPNIRNAASSKSLPTSPAPKVSTSSTMFSATSSPLPPSSPIPRILAASSSLPTSPATKAVTYSSVPNAVATTTNSSTNTARVPTPTPSPKMITRPAQTSPQSPKMRTDTSAPPPPPLTLPPSQLKSDTDPESKIPPEAEQKNVLVQKTVEKPKATLNGDGRKLGNPHYGNKDVETKGKGIHHNKLSSDSDSEEFGIRVITISGENKGAFMELGHSHKKNHDFGANPRSLHNNSNSPRITNNSNESESERKSNVMGKNHLNMGKTTPPMSAFMNSNVQGVNNSILYGSSLKHHDPGVHLSVSRKLNGSRGSHIKDDAITYHN